MNSSFDYAVTLNLHDGHQAIENICSLGSDLHLLQLDGKITPKEYGIIKEKLGNIDIFLQEAWDQILTKHSKAVKCKTTNKKSA